MHTAGVSLAVTPTVLSTFLTHYFNRKPRKSKPTKQLSYDEGLHLIRSFLIYASRHTVEDLQAFTSQWVPVPQWVRVDVVDIAEPELSRAADLIVEQLGPEGIRRVGGREWWRWRKPESPLKAEWIEMKADYQARKANADPGNRIMLYVHGGAYFFGSVDEHRYQIQRHARKLKARALAPRYRLAPQFPFPCGLQDCLATYLHLLNSHEPSAIILAGDSAGGGMILSMMVIMRDQGIPLPAGAVLISPWVDLTHSFPSVAEEGSLDFIPPSGFHHKPSKAWPPPDEDELEELKKVAVTQKKETATDVAESQNSDAGTPTVEDVKERTHRLSFDVDGEHIVVREQLQIYTTNEMLSHPLVSPALQPTLGGLPPLLVIVGGGEMLRDEQIYLAHKCADPLKYMPPEALMDDAAKAQVEKYPPTDVQLQVWDDLCHVAPTLSFTRPAKFMYRSIAQFSAWALARAQHTAIDILDDDQISFISNESDESQSPSPAARRDKSSPTATFGKEVKEVLEPAAAKSVGKAGSPLPPFESHMIRQRVAHDGSIYPLAPAEELPGCSMPRELVGVVKVGTVRKWLVHKRKWDAKFASVKQKIHKARIEEMRVGYEIFDSGDVPPPTALAGRRKIGGSELEGKRVRGLGLTLWGFWGSKHDKMTVDREAEAESAAVEKKGGNGKTQGDGARAWSDLQRQGKKEAQEGAEKKPTIGISHLKAWRRFVRDEKQTTSEADGKKNGERDPTLATPDAPNPTSSAEKEQQQQRPIPTTVVSGPIDDVDDGDTGVTGRRVFLGGVAMPFSLKGKERSASMITLGSPAIDGSMLGTTTSESAADESSVEETSNTNDKDGGAKDKVKFSETSTTGRRAVVDGLTAPFALQRPAETASMVTLLSPVPTIESSSVTSTSAVDVSPVTATGGNSEPMKSIATPKVTEDGDTASFFTAVTPMATPLISPGESRPVLERFVTAQEEVPSVASPLATPTAPAPTTAPSSGGGGPGPSL